MTILQSFYTIAKGGGYFKTEKQALFLLSQCDSAKVYRASSNASFGFGDDGVINCQYDVVVTCDNVGVVSIVHVGHKTRKEKVFFSRSLSHDQALTAQTEKQARKQAFARCDRLESLHRAQLLRLSKLIVNGRDNRLRVIEMQMLVEEKQQTLNAYRNTI